MTNVFISYSPKDSKHMLALRDVVGRMGYKAWIDPNPKPGEDWRYAIDDAVRACDVMLVVVTPNSAESVYVTYEWTLALALGVRVVPVFFKTANVHPRLHTLEYFDVGSFKDIAHFWDYFARELRRIVGVKITPPAPAPMPVPAKIDRSLMPPTMGHWVVIRRGNPLNRMFRLEREFVSLGRDVSNDIMIDDVGISRHHLRFVQSGNSYAIEDLDSTNGILLNGTRIATLTPLGAGAIIQLGDNITLTYEVV